jgi:hypothetical protein
MEVLTDQYLTQKSRSEPAAVFTRRGGKFRPYLQGTVIGLSLVITLFLLPDLIRVFQPPKPIRNGAYATDRTTDRCIANLWEISKMLQEGKRLDSSLTCPKSLLPYQVSGTVANMKVSCPDPEQHGSAELSVTKERPVPEIKGYLKHAS